MRIEPLVPVNLTLLAILVAPFGALDLHFIWVARGAARARFLGRVPFAHPIEIKVTATTSRVPPNAAATISGFEMRSWSRARRTGAGGC